MLLEPRISGEIDFLSDPVWQLEQKRDFDEAKKDRHKASAPQRWGNSQGARKWHYNTFDKGSMSEA